MEDADTAFVNSLSNKWWGLVLETKLSHEAMCLFMMESVNAALEMTLHLEIFYAFSLKQEVTE